MKKLIRKSKRLQHSNANNILTSNLNNNNNNNNNNLIGKENPRHILRRRSSSSSLGSYYYTNSSELMKLIHTSNISSPNSTSSSSASDNTFQLFNRRHHNHNQNCKSSNSLGTFYSSSNDNSNNYCEYADDDNESEDILYINRNPCKSSNSSSSTSSSLNQMSRKVNSTSSSYCYYFFTILFVILILFLQISPSHEQYFSNSGSQLSISSSSSDEWDSPQHFPSTMLSSSSSSSSLGSLAMSSSSSSYGHGYNCFNIPVNFTLCKNIGYSKMMVPNLLGHDSLQEAEYHAKAWVPLLGLQCHPDTQLFLCSLFTPICLDRPIYPCRSLCQGVQAKCEPRMLTYKYPWPSMLKCDQFPEDHDLCIRPGAANTEEKIEEPDCPSCHQAHTCENIVDNYCRANFVFRAKFKRAHGTTMEFRKGRWFKPPQESLSQQKRARPEFRTFELDPKDNCCNNQLTPGVPYIVMGIIKGDQRVITFVMPWNGKDKILKNAVRTFRSMDCSNPLPMSVMALGEEEPRNNKTTRRRATNNNNNNNNHDRGSRRQRRRNNNKDGQVQHQQQQQQQQNNNNHRRGRQYGGCRVTPSTETNQ